jgi:hypothetical protein
MVVKPHSPWRARLMLVLLVGANLLLCWGLYEYGRYRAGYDFVSAQQENVKLKNLTEEVKRQNGQLREQMAVVQRSGQIEHAAYKQVEGTVKGLQDEIAELKSELTFYRGIMAPHDNSRGLHIQRFDLDRNATQHSFHYKLVLTQVLKNDRVIRGRVKLTIEGAKNGKLTELALSDVTHDSVKELSFRFKYFQNLEGDIVLPKGFVPVRVHIDVDPYGRHSSVEKVFDWPAEES